MAFSSKLSPYHRIIIILLLICLLLWVALALAPSKDNPDFSNVEACIAAKAPINYGNLIDVPYGKYSIRSSVKDYKNLWQAVCAGDSKINLPLLFEKALQIENNFTWTKINLDDESGNYDQNKHDRVHELISTAYPKFVPAFIGSYTDAGDIAINYFIPDIEYFKQFAKYYGTEEDRLFFDYYGRLDRHDASFSPWIEQTWSYGGCTRFGKYSWIKFMDEISNARQNFKSAIYQKSQPSAERKLLDTLGNNFYRLSSGEFSYYKICTCNETEAVLKDLTEIFSKYEKDEAFKYFIPKLKITIDGIKNKKIPVKSQAVKHCSGG